MGTHTASVYPGPIGAVLTPQLDHVATDDVAASLPYASTLCGACFDACPVRIDIPRLLVHLRAEVVDATRSVLPSTQEQATMAAASWALGRPGRLDLLARVGALGARLLGRRQLRLPGWASGWSATRAVPLPGAESFAHWWRTTHPGDVGATGRQRRVRAASRRRTGRVHSTVPTPAGLESAPPSNSPLALRAARAPGQDMPDRVQILASIASALGTTRILPDIPRAYRRSVGPPRQPVALFAERVNEYRASVSQVSVGQLPATIADLLTAHASRSLVVPADLPDTWIEGLPLDVIRDDPAVALSALDRTNSVVTACAVAIAETGTVILDGGAAQGRRALTLVPDHHIVVVAEDQIVGGVPDAMSRINPTAPQTWISGPSATSDIELNRVEGVHGPRNLDVIIVTTP